MKIAILSATMLLCTGVYAQEHFAGLSTSRRTGLLNAGLNPAELVNLKSKYEVSIFNFSAGLSNNKITFGDIVDGSAEDEEFDDLVFSGDEPVNLNVNVAIEGPGFGFRTTKWAFALTSAAHVKASLIDINTTLGSALVRGGIEDIDGVYDILQGDNQRAMGTSWGEINLSAARQVYENEKHKFSAGATLKLLFPGTFANMGAGQFNGTVVNNDSGVFLTNAQAQVNFAYSGALGEDFSDAESYSKVFSNGLNGFAADIGFNYQLKDENDEGYKINAGLSFKNMGSMTFDAENNISNNYNLNIPQGEFLDLSQFEDVESIEEIEDIFVASGYAAIDKTQRDFKVKLPAYIAAYADYKFHRRWYATAFLQQRANNDNDNDRIAVRNMFSVTPRYSVNYFEACIPLAVNEVSGFTAGIAFRLGGFYIGSASLLSAAVKDTNQADAYFGFRWGFK